MLVLSTIIGLLVTGRHRSCYSFLAYLGAVLVPGVLMSCWPERFYEPEFWLLKETLHNVLKFAIAVELTVRTVRAFPGALVTARHVFLAVLVFTYVGILGVPVDNGEYATLATEILPRTLNGTIWLLTAITALILWYRLPVDPLHKAILMGFVPYLLAFTVGLNAVSSFGWDVREYANYAYTTAYVALLSYWNYAVWRRPATHSPAA